MRGGVSRGIKEKNSIPKRQHRSLQNKKGPEKKSGKKERKREESWLKDANATAIKISEEEKQQREKSPKYGKKRLGQRGKITKIKIHEKRNRQTEPARSEGAPREGPALRGALMSRA